jgi:hypothetical protein
LDSIQGTASAAVGNQETDAMQFGITDDPQSAMMRRRIDNKLRRYLVLEEINTGPNVTYLRDIYQTKGKA